jgi:predicted DNA-binding transcriptional regulator YafY
MIPERGRNPKVVIRFSKLVARNVAHVNWHKTQRISWNCDGSMDFHVRISGLGGISWCIMGYGVQAIVREPGELRQRIAERARKMLEQYKRTK